MIFLSFVVTHLTESGVIPPSIPLIIPHVFCIFLLISKYSGVSRPVRLDSLDMVEREQSTDVVNKRVRFENPCRLPGLIYT